MAEKPIKLGDRLREIRKAQGVSLREIERRTGLNSGYLSQLERNEIAQPTPSVLHRIADGYGESFQTLMEWAGYVERDPESVSPNHARALSYLPEDISDKELEAIKAVLDALRDSDRPTAQFSVRPHLSDLRLSPGDQIQVRASAMGVLRELDAHRSVEPVDLDEATAVAKLVQAGEIELDLRTKKKLRDRFGDLVDTTLSRLQGMIRFDSNEILLNPDLHVMKRRFVLAHEIGHGTLPDHRLVFGHLDDDKRLSSDFHDLLECQANRFAIELLGKGDLLRREFDDSPPSASQLSRVSSRLGISLQAAGRQVAEESKQSFAIAICWRYRNGSGFGPTKIWASKPFVDRFGWTPTQHPRDEVRDALRDAFNHTQSEPFETVDLKEKRVMIQPDPLETPFALFTVLVPEKVSRSVKLLRPMTASRD
ncbi:MAG: helix-turn-helix domain-containing protein [Thermoleophilia bacterium]|nr:helix-turn-helix domain-containing protein [Thermoleophilia bacterium]